MTQQPFAQIGAGARHQREKRELVDDTLIERGGSRKMTKSLSPQSVKTRERADGLEHLHGEHIRALFVHRPPERLRDELFCRGEIDAPATPSLSNFSRLAVAKWSAT